MPSKRILIALLIIFIFVEVVRSPPAFCSINCSPSSSCSSGSPSACTACATNYMLSPASSPNPCVFNTALTTLKESKISANFVVSPAPLGNCSTFNYWGEYANNTDISLTTTAIPEPHYQIQLIAGLILIDQWPTASNVTFRLISSGQSYVAGQSATQRNEDHCYMGADDGYARWSGIYAHSDTTNPIVWSAKVVYGHSSSKLGIRDLVVITYLCHSWCLTCTGSLSSQCSSCIGSHFLSGTTCDTVCLPGYGTNLPSNICILCH